MISAGADANYLSFILGVSSRFNRSQAGFRAREAWVEILPGQVLYHARPRELAYRKGSSTGVDGTEQYMRLEIGLAVNPLYRGTHLDETSAKGTSKYCTKLVEK